ncbi:MAG: alpha/beta hydrolase [Chromatiales bacterium]
MNQSCKFIFLSLVLLLALTACSSMQAPPQQTISRVDSFDGSSIVYGVSGREEPTIVFVHCWTCNHNFWQDQIDHFAKNYRVVWLDLAGHGDSGRQRNDYSMTAFGKDVAAVVNAVGADKVVLVGHSMGGPVAIEAARQLGDKVIGIVGVDTFYTGFEYPQSQEQVEAFVKPFEQDYLATTKQMVSQMFTPQSRPEVIDWVNQQFEYARPEVGVSAMYRIFDWYAANVPAGLEEFDGRLRNINAAPAGEEKPLHAGVVMIPGVGHFVAQENPQQFNLVLQQMIDEFEQQ